MSAHDRLVQKLGSGRGKDKGQLKKGYLDGIYLQIPYLCDPDIQYSIHYS